MCPVCFVTHVPGRTLELAGLASSTSAPVAHSDAHASDEHIPRPIILIQWIEWIEPGSPLALAQPVCPKRLLMNLPKSRERRLRPICQDRDVLETCRQHRAQLTQLTTRADKPMHIVRSDTNASELLPKLDSFQNATNNVGACGSGVILRQPVRDSPFDLRGVSLGLHVFIKRKEPGPERGPSECCCNLVFERSRIDSATSGALELLSSKSEQPDQL